MFAYAYNYFLSYYLKNSSTYSRLSMIDLSITTFIFALLVMSMNYNYIVVVYL